MFFSVEELLSERRPTMLLRLGFLLLLALGAFGVRSRRRWVSTRVRGGSVSTLDMAAAVEDDVLDKQAEEEASSWLLEQIRRRQERLSVLSESLADAGLPFSSVLSTAEQLNKGTMTAPKSPDWVCVLVTEDKPKSCLIWGDAEPGTKVVRPRLAEDKWVSLAALNGLRRRDPLKASRLWFDQYLLDMRRFSHESGTKGLYVAQFLESPQLVRAASLLACVVLGLFVVGPPLRFLLTVIVTSDLFWRQYGLWSPVVHAPLPLKLLLVRQAYLCLTGYFNTLEKVIVDALVDYESDLFENKAFTLYTEPKPHSYTYKALGGGVHGEDPNEPDENKPDLVDIMDIDPMNRIRLYAIDQIFSKKAQDAVKRLW